MDGIFIESTENQGLLYDRYYKIPEKVEDFLDDIEDGIKDADSSNDTISDKLENKLTKFKGDIEIDMTKPDPINKETVKIQRKKCQKVKDDTLRLLDRLGKLKKDASFDKVKKAKVYTNNADQRVNANKIMRIINRSLDWCEKIILDLMNLADQDMNILSLVQKVYFRTLFEYTDDILSEEIEKIYESYLNIDDDDSIELTDDNIDILDQKVNNEEYLPIFGITISFTKESIGDGIHDEGMGTMLTMAKVIKAASGDVFSHTLFSFDTNFDKIYHFIGKGIVSSDIRTYNVFKYTDNVYVNVLFVTRSEFNIIKNELNQMMQNPESKYDILSGVTMFLRKANHKNRRMVCSSLLGYLLACGNLKNVYKDYSLIRPEDVTLLPRSFYCMEFKNKDEFLARQKEFEDRVQKIYNDNIDEIREYNNILPKIVIKGKLKEKKTLDKFFDWIMNNM